MKRVGVLTIAFALVLLSFPQFAAADDGSKGRHFGPYASSSPDSGTCGNNWAQDTFKREFTVSQDASGTWQLREDFKDGKFVTLAGDSPGKCETSTKHGTTITAGIKGTLKGFESGSVTGAGVTFSPAGGCPDPCTGDEFVAIHFGATATWNVVPFKFTYKAEGKHLAFRHWRNASDDQGGNRGDIATE